MRNLFIIGILLVGAFMAGWFKVNRDGETTTIEINRNEIRSDARNAIDRGRGYLERQQQEYADQQPAQPLQGFDQAVGWSQEQIAQQREWVQLQQQQAQQQLQQQQQQAYPDPNLYQRQQYAPARGVNR